METDGGPGPDQETLLAENAQLRRRCASLEQALDEGLGRIAEPGQLAHQLGVLGTAAVDLAELPPEQDPYHLVATHLAELARVFFVAVNEYDEATDSLVVRAFVGPHDVLDKALEILGRSPIGVTFRITDENARSKLLGGRLSMVRGGLHEATFQQLPRPVASALESLFGMGEIFAVGFAWGHRLHGNATICLRRGEVVQRQVFETFAVQTSIALQRRQAALARRESERTLAQLTDLLPQPVFECDGEGRLSYLNTRTFLVTGYLQEEKLADRTLYDLVADEDHDRARGVLHAAMQGRESRGVELRIRHRDGTTFPAMVFAAPVVHGGRVVGLRGILVDLSEQKRLAAAHHQARRTLEGVLEALPARVFWKDRDFVFQGCNGAFARDAGLPDPLAVVGRSDLQLPWRDQAGAFHAEEIAVIRAAAPRLDRVETLVVAGGRTIWRRISRVPLRDERGAVAGLVGVYEEVDDVQRAPAGPSGG